MVRFNLLSKSYNKWCILVFFFIVSVYKIGCLIKIVFVFNFKVLRIFVFLFVLLFINILILFFIVGIFGRVLIVTIV